MFSLIDFIIVRPIVNILFVIYNLVGDFGIAIILFTIIVKICMWPLVKRQLHQTKLMRKIQPELAEIKKRCNGNRQMESLQMMDLYKRNNIKPFRSFLTILIQLPIFIALYTAIRVMVLPTAVDNVNLRAYAPVQNLERIEVIIDKQTEYLAEKENNDNAEYDFHPQLFGIINLDAKASDILRQEFSASVVATLLFALVAAFIQFWSAKQTMPKKSKSKTFRQMMKEAEQGIDPDQADLNAMASKQMSYMMPVMMFIIMFNLPGALVFYYMITNLITVAQQRYVLNKSSEEMEVSADKAVLKELKTIKEAEIIENKKTGTKITRITARDDKKRSSENKSGKSPTNKKRSK